jgi:flavin reductase (DIM6/NTAB) family NADH-FMN oxidoreductase RutF
MPKKSLDPQTILFPLPAVMVSCQKRGEAEKPNIIMLGIGVRKNRFSWDLIAHSKGFVVNIPTGDLLKATDFCGMRSGKDVDKFAEAKLTPVTCAETGAPLIKECPVNLECELKEMLELGSHTLFIGQIVATHIDSEYMDEKGRPDVDKMNLFCYCPAAHEYRAIGDALAVYGKA